MNEILLSVVSNIVNFLLTTALVFLWHQYKELKDKTEKDSVAIRAGVQSLLRDRMIQAYNHFYEEKGYMPIYARESFTNCYKAYHHLGANGVMDDLYRKALELPTDTDKKGGGRNAL